MVTTHPRRRVLEVGGLATTGAAVGLVGSSVAASDRSNPDVRPVLFVHGGMGSATQFESQAMRFSSNGYPDDHLAVYEYDSLAFEETVEEVVAGLHERLERLRAETGAETVDVLAHSLGTAVMGAYLADPDRAALVENYVNLDGREHDGPPGGVRTLAVWALGAEDAHIDGARNVSFEQGHVEVATSAETFAAVYEFLTGTAPETTAITLEPPTDVTLSGRAAVFPENSGVDGHLACYAIDPKTGERLETVATRTLGADGYWGPIDVDGRHHHEFVVRTGDVIQHLYRHPELRSNQFVRLHVGEAGGLTDDLVDRGPDHVALVINRDREWWGDVGPRSDSLLIDGTDVVTPELAPLEDGIISPMVFDAGADGQSDLTAPVPAFGDVPFLTGVDLFLPATDPPEDTVPVVTRPRGRGGLGRRMAVPNWPSDQRRLVVHVPDHGQSRRLDDSGHPGRKGRKPVNS